MSIKDDGTQAVKAADQGDHSQTSPDNISNATLQNLFDVIHYNYPDDASSDASHLLKKIIRSLELGWFRVDGQAPRLQIRQYITDNQPIIFDFSQLSRQKRAQIMAWFNLEPNAKKKAKRKSNFKYRLTERRGLPEVRTLTAWDKFKQIFSRGRYVYQFRLPKLRDDKPNHIDRIDLSFNQHSMLVDIKQKGKISEFTRREYQLDEKRFIDTCGNHNHKRLTLTDSMVDSLCQIDLEHPSCDINPYLQAKNRFAINTENTALRRKRMLNERSNLGYIRERKPSIYKRFLKNVSKQLNRFVNWWNNTPSTVEPEPAQDKLVTVISKDGLQINENARTGEIHVYEKRLLLKDEFTVVLNGGGAKFYGHVGALEALREQGIFPKNFAGSSAGAIMALLGYLNYELDEIVKNLQYLNKNNLLSFDPSKKGIYNSDKLYKALLYLYLEKIEPIINKYKNRFSAQFCEKMLNGLASYDDLAEIKRLAPDCGLGDNLLVTMTNKDTGENEHASHSHNSHLTVLKTVLASASFPVFIHSTEMKLCDCDDKANCKHKANRYTDGGLTNNLPLGKFKDNGSSLIKHEYGANLNVLAFVFDNGIEQDILYKDGKSVYRESMFSDLFTYLFTNVMPGRKWEEERKQLRLQAEQAILIKVPKHIGATSFNINADDRQLLIDNGKAAAEVYLRNHPVVKGEEYIHKSFESVEELMVYCAYRGKWALLDDIYQQFNILNKQTDETFNTHSKLYDRLQKYASKNIQGEEPQPEQVDYVYDELNVEDLEAKLRKTQLFRFLYPVLIQPLDEIFASVKCKTRLYRPEFKRAFDSLNPENPKECLEALINCFELIGKETHFLTQVLQTIVVACMSIEKVAQHIFDMLAQLPAVISTCLDDQDLMSEDYWGCFAFDEGDCIQLLSGVCDGELDLVRSILIDKTVAESEHFIDNPLYESINQKPDVGVNLVDSEVVNAQSTIITMKVG